MEEFQVSIDHSLALLKKTASYHKSSLPATMFKENDSSKSANSSTKVILHFCVQQCRNSYIGISSSFTRSGLNAGMSSIAPFNLADPQFLYASISFLFLYALY